VEAIFKLNTYIYKKVELVCKQVVEQKNLKLTSATSKKLFVRLFTNKDDEPSTFVIVIVAPANYIIVNSNQLSSSYAFYNSFILNSKATIYYYNTYI